MKGYAPAGAARAQAALFFQLAVRRAAPPPQPHPSLSAPGAWAQGARPAIRGASGRTGGQGAWGREAHSPGGGGGGERRRKRGSGGVCVKSGGRSRSTPPSSIFHFHRPRRQAFALSLSLSLSCRGARRAGEGGVLHTHTHTHTNPRTQPGARAGGGGGVRGGGLWQRPAGRRAPPPAAPAALSSGPASLRPRTPAGHASPASTQNTHARRPVRPQPQAGAQRRRGGAEGGRCL